MLHAKARLGAVFLLTFLLTALSGTVSAQVGPQPFKQENAPPPPTPGNTSNEGTVQVTATVDRTTAPQTVAGIQTENASGGIRWAGHAFISNNTGTTIDPAKDKSGCANQGAEPVVLNTGTKVETYSVFSTPGEMGLKYVLYYHNRNANHWTDDTYYWLDTACAYDPNYNGGVCRGVMYYRPDGSKILFNGKAGAGPFTEAGGDGLVTLTYNPASATYTLQDEDATTKVFSNGGGYLSIKDASGIGWTFSGSQANGIATTTVTHTNGQSYTITSGPLTYTTVNNKSVYSEPVVITDPAGNVYALHTTGANYDLISFPGSPATAISFKYILAGSSDGMSEVDYNGAPYTYTTYRSDTSAYNGWATGTYLADGSQNVGINYETDSAGNVSAVITNPLGHQTTQLYDGTYGSGSAYNGQLSSVNNDAVTDCGSTVATRAYDVNGNLQQTVDNNGNVHTYDYAANGQLQTETEAYGTSIARTTDYVWDPNQQLNRLTSITVEGWSKTAYTYNAQNRMASVAVTNLSGNGTANQTLTTSYNYTLYANGIVHTLSVTHPSSNNSDTDVSTYDTLGNLTSFANGLGQTTTYSNYNGLGEPGHIVGPNGDATDYVYDARGRVQTKTTYPNGTAASSQYTYDGFGMLYTLTTPDNEVTTWNRDAEMRVQTITHNDKDGTSTETFGYDPNGDVTSHVVTRGGITSLSEGALYDALGRLYQKQGQHGQTLTYGYDGNGNVLTVTDAVGHNTVNTYDHLDRLTQTTESGGASPPMPSSAPTLSEPASSNSGDYTVSWTTVSGATNYFLQEEVNGGSWVTAINTGSTSWNASSQPSGSYGYQVKACNATGCSPWSAQGSTTVSIPTAPTSAPALTVPASSATGSYAVSWAGVTGAASYNLQQRINSGSWTTVQSSAATGWNASGEASGSYAYQVQACNAVGCGPWSTTGTTTVTLPPIPGAPTLTVPANNGTGSYTVSWGSVSGASSYNLQQQVNGGGWTTVASPAASSWAASGEASGSYGYRVQSCNVSGCSGWSSTGTVTVTIPVPLAINGQSYTESYAIPQGKTGSAEIGFGIASGTWSVFGSKPSATNATLASGAVPAAAVTVQYVWTNLGAAPGDAASTGTLSNPAASPVALTTSPSSYYATSTYSATSSGNGEQYQLTVTFFNAAGINVSSSTCTLTAKVVGTD